MLYILASKTIGIDKQNYNIFETHTESMIVGLKENIQRLVNKCHIEAKNAKITNEEVLTNQWPYGIRLQYANDCTYVLLAKINEQKFKLVIRSSGEIVYMNAQELIEDIEAGYVVNCSVENGDYKSIDTYDIKTNSKFERDIKQKYEEFRAKSIMLGLDISFDYSIENKEVKILHYSGTSKRVIIPSFITTINKHAFMSANITELKLNEGLKYIGLNAFANNDIGHVIIPYTVELMGHNALDRNDKLVDIPGSFRDTVKRLNEKTIILW